jgi:hypothetical protein
LNPPLANAMLLLRANETQRARSARQPGLARQQQAKLARRHEHGLAPQPETAILRTREASRIAVCLVVTRALRGDFEEPGVKATTTSQA